MRKLAVRLLLAPTLFVSLICMAGIASVHAAASSPYYEQCSSTQQVQERHYYWTNNGQLSGWDQRLDVYLYDLRDKVNNAYCSDMRGTSILNYRHVSNSTYLTINLCPYPSGNCIPDQIRVPAYTGSSSYRTATADTGLQPINRCAYVSGEWYDPGVVDITIPQGIDEYCAY